MGRSRDDERDQTPHGEGLQGLERRGEVDRPVGPRPDVAAALRDERFPLTGGEGAKETHAMERARRGGEIVEQLGELGLDEPVDVEDADGSEVLAREDSIARAPRFHGDGNHRLLTSVAWSLRVLGIALVIATGTARTLDETTARGTRVRVESHRLPFWRPSTAPPRPPEDVRDANSACPSV